MSKSKNTQDDDDPSKRMNSAYYAPAVSQSSPATHGHPPVPGIPNSSTAPNSSTPAVPHQYDDRPYAYPQYGYPPYDHPDMVPVPQAPAPTAPYPYKPGQYGYYPPPPDGFQFQDQWDPQQPQLHMHGAPLHPQQTTSSQTPKHASQHVPQHQQQQQHAPPQHGAPQSAVPMIGQVPQIGAVSSAQAHAQAPPPEYAMNLGVRPQPSPLTRRAQMKRAPGAGSASIGGTAEGSGSVGSGNPATGVVVAHTGGRLSRRASEVLPTIAQVASGAADLLLLTTLLPGEHKTVAKRSRMGCLTCRQRKKRCCETRPKCTECTRLRLNCVWPAPGTEHKNKPKDAKEEENTINHEIYGKIKVLRGIVEYRSS